MTIDVRGVCPLLQVFDMNAALAFYRDTLGFSVVRKAESAGSVSWALLRLNGAEVMLNAAFEKDRKPSTPDPSRIAAHQDTSLFFNCADVDAVYSHFRAQGWDVKEPTTRDYGRRVLSVFPEVRGLTNRWSARVADKVPSPNSRSRGAQLNR